MPRISRSKRLEYVLSHGRLAISWAALEDGLKHFTIQGKEGFIPYKVQSKILLVPGEPLCSEKDVPIFFKEFKKFAVKKKYSICFFGTKERLQKDAENAGYDVIKFAEEAVLDPKEFTLRGNKMLNVRRGINRCSNVGVKVFEYLPDEKKERKLEKELNKISKEWLASKPTPELGFLMGRPDLDRMEGRRIFVAVLDEKPQAFLMINPIPSENSWYADILRRSSSAPNGVMETLSVHVLDSLKEEGAEKLYFGMVPFIGIDPDGGNHPKWNKFMHNISTKFSFFYPVQNEYFFKNKFRPGWEPVYMFNYPDMSVKIVYAVMSAFIPTGITGLLKHKISKK